MQSDSHGRVAKQLVMNPCQGGAGAVASLLGRAKAGRRCRVLLRRAPGCPCQTRPAHRCIRHQGSRVQLVAPQLRRLSRRRIFCRSWMTFWGTPPPPFGRQMHSRGIPWGPANPLRVCSALDLTVCSGQKQVRARAFERWRSGAAKPRALVSPRLPWAALQTLARRRGQQGRVLHAASVGSRIRTLQPRNSSRRRRAAALTVTAMMLATEAFRGNAFRCVSGHRGIRAPAQTR